MEPWGFSLNELQPVYRGFFLFCVGKDRLLTGDHQVLSPHELRRRVKVAGFDMGAKYSAWAVVSGSFKRGFHLIRHGYIYPPSLGETATYGHHLPMWGWLFQCFVQRDLKPHAVGIERFTYRPGSAGQSAEAINLTIPPMVLGSSTFLVRNTEWKGWFKRHVSKEGAEDYFKLPSPHEADAAGIALYTACVRLYASLANERKTRQAIDDIRITKGEPNSRLKANRTSE